MIALASATTTLDGQGGANVVLGPVPPWRAWSVARIALEGNGASEPQARLYQRPARVLGGTYTANADTYEFPSPAMLAEAEALEVVWSGGSPGSTVTAIAWGDQAQR